MKQRLENCWEFMKCGREPGGLKANQSGICPAADDLSFDGINSGVCGGRICWAVAGTFCNGKVQGTFAEKRKSCTACEFYRQVQTEEDQAERRPKFLKFISEANGNPVFDKMRLRRVKAGERFVTQGEVSDTAFIIERGSCLVIVEKEGVEYPVNHYGQGDIVGGVGILTGEPRLAHVEAETDMDLWVLKRSQFEDISKESPEILDFLTEIVADRFDSRRPTAYRTIGKYIATDIIGRGGYSIVYKGMHKTLHLPVAIKMMRHDMAVDTEFIKTFQNEAKTIAGLSHENIVKIFDIEERYRTLFIIMEHVTGKPLSELIKQLKVIPPQLAVDFLVQICEALCYAHERKIIHRDINPTNIIVQQNDRLKILDFGLACPVGTEDFSNAGTAFYMAPEQIEGNPVDPRTDIYALGITAYEMVTGMKPFSSEDLSTLLDMNLKQDVPDPARAVRGLPEALGRFILRAGRRDPGQRYPNAREALAVLRPLAKETKHVSSDDLASENRKASTIFLSYNEEQQFDINRLLDEFSAKAQSLGITFKIADFRES
ncbi:MAG TPA: protein kinase [Deltaproteobacteria bacterium]|nr:protein kinase [Deltaproteobacteria bacterium]